MMAKLNLHLLREPSGMEVFSGFLTYLHKLLSRSVLFIRKAVAHHTCASYEAAWRTKAVYISQSCQRQWKRNRKYRAEAEKVK